MSEESTAKQDSHKQQRETGDSDATPVPAGGKGAAPGEAWPEEFGGPKGPEPTRFGDWEKKGRVSDF